MEQNQLDVTSKPLNKKVTSKRKNNLCILLFSGLIHLTLLFIAYCLISSYTTAIKKDVIITTGFNSQGYKFADTNTKPDLIKEHNEKETLNAGPITSIDEIDKPIYEKKMSDGLLAQKKNHNLVSEELIGTSLMGAIQKRKGALSNRYGIDKKKALLQGGGSYQTEMAVEAALQWLMRHQENDGHWDKKKFGIEMDNKGFERRKIEMDSVLTALATLAFISAGNTPKSGKYSEVVTKSVNWILKRQLANGSFGNSYEFSVYNNSLCSIVLSELAVMCPDQSFSQPAQKAIHFLGNLKKVHEGFSNYSHIPRSTSVNGWLLMAFKSAKMANLETPPNFYENLEKHLNEITNKDQSGVYQFVNYMEINDRQNRRETMTAVGLLMYEYLGYKRNELQGLADTLIKSLPQFDAKNIRQEMYRWYNTSLALFQFGGEHWRIWNAALSSLLIKHQRLVGPLDGTKNDLHGSWDCENDHFGQNLGRVYTTAMSALCLEVYYRYDHIYKNNTK